MIDLSQIGDRIGKGQYSPSDLQVLLEVAYAEGVHIDSTDFDRGVVSAGDLQEIYESIQNVYATKYGRQTDEEKWATDRAAGEQAKADADAQRKAESLSQFQAEQAAATERLDSAQSVSDAQASEAAANAAVERFKAAKAAADEIAAKRHKLAQSLNEALNG